MLAPWKKSYDQHRPHIKKQRHYFADIGPSSQSYGFSISHVWMWDLDYKESWVYKNWFFWTAVLEKTLESPLNFEEIQPVHPKGNQLWIFIGRTDVEGETPVLWSLDAKNRLIGKDPDTWKDWRWEEKGPTENEIVGWHYWLDGHEIEQAPGVGVGLGGLACCSPWGCRELGTTERLNWTELMQEHKTSYSRRRQFQIVLRFLATQNTKKIGGISMTMLLHIVLSLNSYPESLWSFIKITDE